MLISCPRHDIKIILDDLNSKTGREIEFPPLLLENSLHNEYNENDVRLIAFIAVHDMIVTDHFLSIDIFTNSFGDTDGNMSESLMAIDLNK